MEWCIFRTAPSRSLMTTFPSAPHYSRCFPARPQLVSASPGCLNPEVLLRLSSARDLLNDCLSGNSLTSIRILRGFPDPFGASMADNPEVNLHRHLLI